MPETTFIIVISTYQDILEYDMAFMMERGTVVQKGFPADIIRNEKSILSTIIKKQGLDTFAKLFVKIGSYMAKKIDPRVRISYLSNPNRLTMMRISSTSSLI